MTITGMQLSQREVVVHCMKSLRNFQCVNLNKFYYLILNPNIVFWGCTLALS